MKNKISILTLIMAIDQPSKKVGWHAVVGILPPFRFWSGYDALYNRDG